MELIEVKNIINHYSNEKHISVQSAWDIFFFDEIIYRLSISEYKNMFIFKGGYYLQNILGVETRSTMDIDFKMVGSELSDEELLRIFRKIISLNSESKIKYDILKISNITAETKYGGKTIKIAASFYNIKKVFGIDIGFGDVVTPFPIQYRYSSMLSSKKYDILAYSIETSIAEKFETIVSKGANNSRSKDLIDIYLYMNYEHSVEQLNAAVINTFNIRGTQFEKDYIECILSKVFNSERHRVLFENYRSKNAFAASISYEMCKDAVYIMLEKLVFPDKIKLSDYGIELHIVRHGKDEEDKMGGWSDNHLTREGIAEIEMLKNKLDDDYDVFISSDLNRARESSNILNEMLKMSVIYDEGFRETNNGLLKNLTKKEFGVKYPGLYYSLLKMDEKYPNGESPNMFYERVKTAFEQLLCTYHNKKILLVTHGGVITVILSLVNGYKYSNMLKITPPTGTMIIIK